MPGRSIVLLVGVAALTGVVALLQFRPDGKQPTVEGAAASDPTDELEALRGTVARLEEELARAHADNRAMAEEIDWLLAEVRDYTAAQAALDAPPASANAASEAEDESAGDAAPDSTGIDEAAVRAAGFDPRDVEEVHTRLDALSLERLYLRDAATREGWRGTERWRSERRALAAELAGIREEYGEDLYDWGLYAAGQANRVKVADVLRGSAAAAADLKAGDVIVRYGDRRVFDIRDLRMAAMDARPGENTEVLVLRDGDMRRVFLPGGPLGVTPEPIVLQPIPR